MKYRLTKEYVDIVDHPLYSSAIVYLDVGEIVIHCATQDQEEAFCHYISQTVEELRKGLKSFEHCPDTVQDYDKASLVMLAMLEYRLATTGHLFVDGTDG